MQENILLFLLFSISAIIIIHNLPDFLRKYGVFCANLIFYFLCDAKFLLLILFSTIWSYLTGRKIVRAKKHKIFWLWIGIIPVVLILCAFKYYKFFTPQKSSLLLLTMPLGLSYYTFKIISYLADIYKNKYSAHDSLINYSIYISFFPQIICGPISRFDEINKDLNHIALPSYHLIHQGCMFILSGLFKKLVIADRLSGYVTVVFSNYVTYPAIALWMAAFFFAIQIYCDFAGYSEIVIGISNLFGIECNLNFNRPYFSYSIKDFWRKWHISLSSWLRDYIYIPLGGNRKGTFRKKVNIIITFFISGLWHGTGFHFICWGLWHGILNIFSNKKSSSKYIYFLQIISTFLLIMFGWIIFRSNSFFAAIQYTIHMFYPFSISFDTVITAIMPFTGDYSCLSHFITISVFILLLFLMELQDYKKYSEKVPVISKKRIVFFAISIVFFGMIGQNSFLYANF